MFSNGKPLPKALYVIGVAVIFLTVYSQYFIRFGAITGYLVVYGIPIAVVSIFFGKELLSRAAKNNKTAAQLGLALFGALTAVSILLILLVVAILLQFNPQIQTLLNKPNPVLDVPPNEAWILMVVSILVVGPVEEYLFRGFIFGGLLNIFKGRHWFLVAIVSSMMFALLHAYYAVTYGVASIVPFIDLIAFGIAMCIAYYWSGGNLLVLALIHGIYNATGFLGVATTINIGLIARGILIFVGILCALVYLPKKIRLPPIKAPDAPALSGKPVSTVKQRLRRFPQSLL